VIQTTEKELKEAQRLIGSNEFDVLTPHEQYETYAKAALKAAYDISGDIYARYDLFHTVMASYIANSPWKIASSFYNAIGITSVSTPITSGSPDNILSATIPSPDGQWLFAAVSSPSTPDLGCVVNRYGEYLQSAGDAADQVSNDEESLNVCANTMDGFLKNAPWKISGSMYYLFYFTKGEMNWPSDTDGEDIDNQLWMWYGTNGLRSYIATSGFQAL